MHSGHMATVDVDAALVAEVQARFGLRTEQEAVDFALRSLIVQPMTDAEAKAMAGSGWDGDLDAMRADVVPDIGDGFLDPSA